jgi:hypothetical protein
VGPFTPRDDISEKSDDTDSWGAWGTVKNDHVKEEPESEPADGTDAAAVNGGNVASGSADNGLHMPGDVILLCHAMDCYGMIGDADGHDYTSCDKGNGYEVGDKGTASNDGNEIIGKDDGGIGQWVRIGQGQESGYKGTGAATRGNDGRGKNTNRVGKGEIIDKGGGGIGQWGRSCHESGYKGIGKATRGNDGHGNGIKKTCR